MTQANLANLRRTWCVWVMAAAAPMALAQTPSQRPATPAPAPADKLLGGPDASGTLSPGQAGYIIGLTFGEQMRRADIADQVDLDAVKRGMMDGLAGKRATAADQQQVNAYVRSARLRTTARNAAAAKEFLAKNAHQQGVITTASGLEYKVIEPGDAKAPAVMPADEVSVQYRGTLLDGTEFDSTYARGVPMTFKANGVIPGWQEALALMKPGAKWLVFVPPELAYGANGQGPIPGGSVLKFEVQLLSVKPSGAPPAAPVAPVAPVAPIAKPAPKSN
ncbi:MAG: FKBP-type peptidyl-prolyl cis-trans isomerase [Steroidobacteraceae bacterium]